MSALSSTSLPWYRAIRPRSPAAHGLPRCIHQAFADAARAEPGRALLVDESGYLKQGALLDAVQTRARDLLERAGATDRVVAVQLDPSIATVITYFACLAAGLRYLPLPAVPSPWSDRLLASLPAPLLVTRCDLRPASGDGLEMVLVDARDAYDAAVALPDPNPRRIAHVLPTSGTETGTPKAVLTDHVGSMLSHDWRSRLWPYDPARDVVGCNVFGIWDAVPALCRGIPVVMIGDATLREPAALAASIVRYSITRLMLTPTLLDACLADEDAADALRRLRRLVLCGEPVMTSLAARAREALPRVQLANLYSLSECHDVAAGDVDADAPVTAGHVAEFAEVHVTDPGDPERLVPAGKPGRVLIGGEALAAGYLDPELTARRFFDAAFVPDEVPRRVYDSGDLGVLHEDGRLEILGRLDDAVKVRGGWAEPEAVARILRQHPRVARAAVVAETDAGGKARLSAFAVASGTAAAPDLAESLRRWLAERVGPHSLPTRLSVVDRLPLSPSGKVDLRRLRDPGRGGKTDGPAGNVSRSGTAAEPAGNVARGGGTPEPAGNVTRGGATPESAGNVARSGTAAESAGGLDHPETATERSIEQTVLEIFRDVIDAPDAGLDDDLDSLGADSLSLIVLGGELRRRLGRRVRVAELRRLGSARALARSLERAAERGPRMEWRWPALELGIDTKLSPAHSEPVRRVLVTGATGVLGRALIDRLINAEPAIEVAALVRARDVEDDHRRLSAIDGHGTGDARLEAIVGDLALPRFGLAPDAFRRLAAATDAVLHVGADLDMFADYAALEAANVGGTREALRLAFEAGARMHHVSSSAVLPLDSDRVWSEESFGFELVRSLAPELARSDGYSRSKAAAEGLAWLAAERGLYVAVTRLPHLVGRGLRTRLSETLRALAAARVLPEGEWRWQAAPIDAVCARLVSQLTADAPAPLEHLTARPVRGGDVASALRARGIDVEALPLPAVVNALGRTSITDERDARAVSALNQLIAEHGPRAALSLADARLASRRWLDAAPGDVLDCLLSNPEDRNR